MTVKLESSTAAQGAVPWIQDWHKRFDAVKTWCKRCVYSDQTPAITFDAEGICNYCRLHERLDREHPTGADGERVLRKMAEQIRRDGRGKKFDVVVGVSGGCDSSYLLHRTIELGLRPLAAHFDNTWDSTIAVENIQNVLGKLGVELFTLVVDNEQYDDLYRAILRAGVPDLEAPTDLALASTQYMAAEKYGIRYIFEGHSFRTEGVSPLGWLYMDGRYVADLARRNGAGSFDTFPNLWLHKQLKWMVLKRIKKLRPLWYIDHKKEETKAFLAREYGWKWYGGHHLENRITAFYHTYFLPRRFGIDQRVNGLSALIRSGQGDRDAAIEEIRKPPAVDYDLVQMVKKRYGFDDDEFERLMTLPKKTYVEFKSYKPLFERFRPFFWLLAQMDLIPKSFYIKYTSKKNI
jgi:N-acetyl sugar amidotransferase